MAGSGNFLHNTSADQVDDALIDRHTVPAAQYIHIKRWGHCERVDGLQYWPLFRDKAYELSSSFGHHQGVSRSNLILSEYANAFKSAYGDPNLYSLAVTGLADAFRTSSYKFSSRENQNCIPPDVTGIEVTDPDDTRVVEWHYDMTGYDQSQFSIVEERSVLA